MTTHTRRFFITPRWLADRLLCARYAHLPLANIGPDAPCAMADAFFGRLLRHNRHVLWASESSRPDLGGTEGDDNDVRHPPPQAHGNALHIYKCISVSP